MRDLLTFLAGLVILVLVAALAVPPFVDWRAQRDYVDAAISKAAGLPVATEGALEVRLLPSPRLRIERMRIGNPAGDDASLLAHFVRAEIALPPLLSGEIRFLDSRVGRLEAKLPTGTGGDWRIPRALLAADALQHAFVFENLSVLQLFVTMVEPGTGRTDQIYAEGVRVEAQSLAGPWRIEGQADGTPFTLLTGALDPDGQTAVKLNLAGEKRPRIALDGRLVFQPEPDGANLRPVFEGTARIAAGPEAGAPVPVVATSQVRSAGRAVDLDAVVIEAGEGTGAARLTGSGRISIDERRAVVALEGRRVDLDALLRQGAAAPSAAARLPVAVDGTLKLDSAALGGEELTGLQARFALDGTRLAIPSLDVTVPGGTAVTASGTADLVPNGAIDGRVALKTRAADRFVAWLGRLGFGAVPSGMLDGRAAEASADIVVAAPVASLRNLRIQVGDGIATGLLRYTAAEPSGRPRLDAQLAVQNLDLTAAPSIRGAFDAAGAFDLGLILDARNVGYGTAERGGRIAARIRSDGLALAVDRLEIVDLAGANASLSGQLEPGGGGRIAGRLTARRAAPLVDLVGRPWLGPIVDLVPAFVREGDLDLEVTASRTGAGALTTRLSGTASGGSLAGEVATENGRTLSLSADLGTPRAGTWFGRPADPALARPARMALRGTRPAGGALALSLDGEVAGLRIATRTPFGLTPEEDGITSGEAAVVAADAAPLLAAAGFGAVGAVPVDLAVTIARDLDLTRIKAAGRIAGTAAEMDLRAAGRAAITGSASLGRVSLPGLAAFLVVPPGGPEGTDRFAAPPPIPVGGSIAVSAATLDLGRGLAGGAARFDLATVPDGIAVRGLEATLFGGRVEGAVTLTRQGGLASLIGEGSLAGASLPAVAGPPFAGGTLGVQLRFGSSGETASGLMGNLGGAGTVAIDGLSVAGADAGAGRRAAARALQGDDPLAQPRLLTLVSDELGRAPFVATATVAGPGSLVGGVLRIAPLAASDASGSWQGAASIDLRTASLDIRGALTARESPRTWSGAPPTIGLGWLGPVGWPNRVVDVGPLANGLASVVLTRELERIEVFELDAAERARINGRQEMDRARKAAAEEAIRQARLKAEAEERARRAADLARQEAERILNVAPGGEMRASPTPPIPPAPLR